MVSASTAQSSGSGRRGPRKRTAALSEVRRVSVVDEVVEQMTRKIIAGVWPPGTSLPSLRGLAAESGVSMLSVREAVRTLQARGWVESRHGVGTFVLKVNTDGRFVPWTLGASDVTEYGELIEARESIESAIIGFAALRHTEEQLDTLDALQARMHAAGDDCERFLSADADFHIVLAEAARNRILLRSMLAIRSPMRRLMANRLLAEIEERGDLGRSLADHQQILDAVRAGDPGTGRRALGRITERGRGHLHRLDAEAGSTGGRVDSPPGVPR